MGQIVEFAPIAHWNGSKLCNFKSQQMKPIYHWKHFNNSMFFGGLYQILIKLTHPKNTTFETPTPKKQTYSTLPPREPNIPRDLLQQAFGTGPWWRESHLGYCLVPWCCFFFEIRLYHSPRLIFFVVFFLHEFFFYHHLYPFMYRGLIGFHKYPRHTWILRE